METAVAICRHGLVDSHCRICDLEARVKLGDAIALAVMTEREHYAKIAESYFLGGRAEDEACGDLIAARIRSGE